MCEWPGQTKNTEEFDDGLEVECSGVLVDRSSEAKNTVFVKQELNVRNLLAVRIHLGTLNP